MPPSESHHREELIFVACYANDKIVWSLENPHVPIRHGVSKKSKLVIAWVSIEAVGDDLVVSQDLSVFVGL